MGWHLVETDEDMTLCGLIVLPKDWTQAPAYGPFCTLCLERLLE